MGKEPPTDEAEAVARLIDPEAWRSLEDELSRWADTFAELAPAYPASPAQREEAIQRLARDNVQSRKERRASSLAKARAILALPFLAERAERIEALEGALAQAGSWFRDYQRQHEAKGTQDAADKAVTNAARASFCERRAARALTPGEKGNG